MSSGSATARTRRRCSGMLSTSFPSVAATATMGLALWRSTVSTVKDGACRSFETASSATPVVAAAAALLVQSAHRYPTFSQSSVRTLEGEVLYDAERPEVIKAILMAGADRVASNDDGTSVSDYRGSLDRRTDNGLDRRYGAGQLNVLNSYAILSGG